MVRRAVLLVAAVLALASCRGGRSYFRVTVNGDPSLTITNLAATVTNAGTTSAPVSINLDGKSPPVVFALEFDADRSGDATVDVHVSLADSRTLDSRGAGTITPGETIDVVVSLGGSPTGGDGGTMPDGGTDGGNPDGASTSCTDKKQNGQETDVDCGGPDCEPCVLGLKCSDARDCRSNACVNTCVRWEPTGPWGGVIRALEIRPGSDDIALAGTIDGLYRTTNGGAWWRKVPITGYDPVYDEVNAIAYQPGKPQVQWVGTDGMLVGTTNDGVDWSSLDLSSAFGGAPWKPIQSLAVGKGGTLYVGTPSGVVAAKNGTLLGPRAIGSSSITALLANPARDDEAWAGTDGDGVFHTTNGGASWAPLADPTPVFDGHTVNGLAIAPGPNGTTRLYVASDAGLLVGDASTGGSWQTAFGFNETQLVRGVAIDPTNPMQALVVAETGVYRYASGTWVRADSPGVPRFAVGLVARYGQDGSAWAGTTAGVFRRTASGMNFASANRGMHAYDVRSLVLHPTKPNTVFATVSLGNWGAGLLESDDATETWKVIDLPAGLAPRTVEPVQVVGDVRLIVGGVTDPYQPGIGTYALSTGTWGTKIETLPGASNGVVTAIGAVPGIGTRVLAGVANGNGAFDSWGVYANNMNGAGAWAATNTGVPSQSGMYDDVTSFAFDGNSTPFAAASGSGVLKWDVLLSKWSVVSNPDPDAGGFGPVRVLATRGSTLYAGADNGVWVCDDTRALSLSWRAFGNLSGHSNAVFSLATDPNDARRLWIGTLEGVARTDALGTVTDWQSFAPWVQRILVDPSDSQHVYAGTGGSGIWRTTTGGK